MLAPLQRTPDTRSEMKQGTWSRVRVIRDRECERRAGFRRDGGLLSASRARKSPACESTSRWPPLTNQVNSSASSLPASRRFARCHQRSISIVQARELLGSSAGDENRGRELTRGRKDIRGDTRYYPAFLRVQRASAKEILHQPTGEAALARALIDNNPRARSEAPQRKPCMTLLMTR
jgi:hypothetical protein